jgi:hypothetical protein
VSTFVDRGVSRGQRGGSPTVVNLSFLDRIRSIIKRKTKTNFFINFVKSNGQTNTILLLSIPQQHKPQNYSHINDELKYNWKLYKIGQTFNYTKVVEFDSN